MDNMTRYINNILIGDSGYEYGFITGDDGNSYYFDERLLDERVKMADCNIRDEVEFEILEPTDGHRYGSAKGAILVKYKSEEEDNKGKSTEEEKDEIIKYYKPGFAVHMDKKQAYNQFLKENSGEEEIIDKISRVLYISRIGHHIIDQRSTYQFCLAGATKMLKQFIQGKCEFLVILSHFDSEDWQSKNLIVDRELRKRREISDRRPLVNFYILISNARCLMEEIEKVKGSTSAAVIPFSFNEILECDSKDDLEKLFVERFGQYLYENNMLGETSAIDDDNLLFGDRGKIADLIVNRCENNANSGIFGLRRSGKTSVLNAVLRRLERTDIKYVKVESRSELENLDSWKIALYDIAKKIRQRTLGIEQQSGESRKEFIEKLKLNSTEEDYLRRPSVCFVEDIKLYCANEKVFVIAIDEIELITFNTAKEGPWKSVAAYCGFWGAMRDCGCSLIMCGVNSTINEINSIYYNGENGDNPMYKRILNCADFSSTYLPTFTDEQTKYMINTLGGFSNIGFSEVYSEINSTFGGQPYAIRQFCSYVFERVKQFRETNKVYEVSKATIENLLLEFQNSAEGISLCEIILQHLTIYKDEYEMLKGMALSPEKYRKIEGEDIYKIDHLQKYGLINFDYNTTYVSFKIHSIKEYICKKYEKNPMDMTNDERREYVQTCVAECEVKLKTYLCNYYIYNANGESACRNLMKRYINSNSTFKPVSINPKADSVPNPDTCNVRDFFDHKKYIIYFSSIKTIINNNWSTLGQKLQAVGIDKNKFLVYMDALNAGRTDADHYDAENIIDYPDGWVIDDTVMSNFQNAMTNLNSFFETI